MRTKALSMLAAVALALSAPALVTAQGEVAPLPAEPPPVEQPVAETTPAAEAQVPAAEEQAPVAEPSAPDSTTVTAEASVTTDEASAGEELPRTASPLALLALLGIGSAGSALGVRIARRG